MAGTQVVDTEVEDLNFTSIVGMAPARLPRLGKIRLGEKRKSARSGKEYPAELPSFKFDPEALEQWPAIREIYGEQPRELDVILPSDDAGVYLPQALKLYGAGGRLKCKGNKQRAARTVCAACAEKAGGTLTQDQVNGGYGLRCGCKDGRGQPMNDTVRIAIPCPCVFLQGGECAPRANLMVILPRISIGGVWQIDTGSFVNSVADIMGSLEYIVRPICGRVAMVPLKLRRVPKKDGRGVEHYPLQITLDADMKQAARIAQSSRSAAFLIEAPHDDGDDLPPVVTEDDPDEDSPEGSAAAAAPAGSGNAAEAPRPKAIYVTRVRSSDGKTEYTVTQYQDESWSCTCPGFTHRKTCKHVDETSARRAAEAQNGDDEKTSLAKPVTQGEFLPGEGEHAVGKFTQHGRLWSVQKARILSILSAAGHTGQAAEDYVFAVAGKPMDELSDEEMRQAADRIFAETKGPQNGAASEQPAGTPAKPVQPAAPQPMATADDPAVDRVRIGEGLLSAGQRKALRLKHRLGLETPVEKLTAEELEKYETAINSALDAGGAR